jgi:hypothetical protein
MEILVLTWDKYRNDNGGHIVIGYGCLTPLSTILFSYIIIVSISGGGKQITK